MSAQQDALVSTALFRLLELLAMEVPPQRFDEPLETARQGGACPESQVLLHRAKALAFDIHGLVARRRQHEAGLAALVDTARELTLPYDLDALLKVIARRARLLLNLDMAWVSLYDPVDDRSYVRTADGHSSAITIGFRLPVSGGIGNAAADRSAPFWTPDYLADERFTHSPVTDDVVRAEGLRALIAVPLQEDNTPFGALYVADRRIRHFTQDEITLMASLGDLVAVAIKKARLLTQARTEISELEEGASRALDSSFASRRLFRTHSELTDLVLRGCTPYELAERGAKELGGALLVRDAAGRELATAGAFPEIDEMVLLGGTLDAHTEQAPVRSADGLWFCPVAAGAEALGTLVLALPESSDTRHLPLLRAVAQSAAVLLQMQRSAEAADGQVRDDLFHELLGDTQRTPAQLAERARRLTVDLTSAHVVVVARPEGGSPGRALLWASSYAHRHSGLRTTDTDGVVLLLPGTDPGAVARSAGQQLSAVLGCPVTVGAAGPAADPGSINRTYQEARRCLDALTALGRIGSTASPRELGFLGLLLSDRPDAVAFIKSAIGPVLEYDAQQYTELVRTMDAYFAAGNSPSRAAESLHVHPNTVSRRLERITELLGAQWQGPVRALEIQLALRLHQARHTLRRQDPPLPGRRGPG
ncbi:helix-turn-helix domain-containing protein [Streptomyces sp. NPDC089919]|uniref:helix-turn-helix domain-containing protein n=1 Tax=Streptomyces sp. NPDC089919 TaxID=3155188 RepID=UPI003418B48A